MPSLGASPERGRERRAGPPRSSDLGASSSGRASGRQPSGTHRSPAGRERSTDDDLTDVLSLGSLSTLTTIFNPLMTTIIYCINVVIVGVKPSGECRAQ